MDDVPTGQPALALAQKVIVRVNQSGLPADLVPAGITSVAVSPETDAENGCGESFRSSWTQCDSRGAIAAERRGEDVPEELDMASLGAISEEEWRAFGPSGESADPVADTEPAPDPIPEPSPVEVPEPEPVDVPEPGDRSRSQSPGTPDDVGTNGAGPSKKTPSKKPKPSNLSSPPNVRSLRKITQNLATASRSTTPRG